MHPCAHFGGGAHLFNPNPQYSVIARIYAVNSWQSTQKIKSARSANPCKSFLLLFCFCKKVESLYPLDSNSQRMKFLGCFGKSLNRLAMTIRHTTFKGITNANLKNKFWRKTKSTLKKSAVKNKDSLKKGRKFKIQRGEK